MDIDIYQRENGGGKKEPVLKIRCRAYNDQLRTVVKNKAGEEIAEIITER